MATITTPLSNRAVNSRFSIIASAISVTWKEGGRGRRREGGSGGSEQRGREGVGEGGMDVHVYTFVHPPLC